MLQVSLTGADTLATRLETLPAAVQAAVRAKAAALAERKGLDPDRPRALTRSVILG